jgi:catechol 2,3-dioxygenase-like lactoylglutathione lyase family enzyme
MILGLDHVQFFVSDMAHSALAFEGLGYRIDFKQENFTKGILFSHFQEPRKDMAFLKSSHQSVSIELVSATTKRSRGQTRVYPVFGGVSPGMSQDTGQIDRLTKLGLAYVKFAGLEAGLEKTDRQKPYLSKIILLTDDLLKSREFFGKILGFKTSECHDGILEVSQPRNIFSNNLDITLMESSKPAIKYESIDHPGSGLLSFISTDLSSDMDCLIGHGCDMVGEVNSFEINHRAVTAAVFSGPGSELLELIQFGVKTHQP